MNLWREAISIDLNDHFGIGQCDYFDIFLDLVRSYYLDLNLPKVARSQLLNHQDWFNFFGVGEEGWYTFVDYYHFKPYVNYKYEVKDLFASYEQYSKKDCTEIVGTYHGWDYCLLRCGKENRTVPIIEAKNHAYN